MSSLVLEEQALCRQAALSATNEGKLDLDQKSAASGCCAARSWVRSGAETSMRGVIERCPAALTPCRVRATVAMTRGRGAEKDRMRHLVVTGCAVSRPSWTRAQAPRRGRADELRSRQKRQLAQAHWRRLSLRPCDPRGGGFLISASVPVVANSYLAKVVFGTEFALRE
jgi:hypothetical protein